MAYVGGEGQHDIADRNRPPARRNRGRGAGAGARSSRVAIDSGEGGGYGEDDGRQSPPHTGRGDRRALRFWQPFNDWWRQDLDRLGRRPNAQEILAWYSEHAQPLWRDDAPSLQETRVHAKCLRSLPLVRNYFRSYRAKKKGAPGDDDYEGDDGGGGNDDGGATFANMNPDELGALRFAAMQQQAFRMDFSAGANGFGGGNGLGGGLGGGGPVAAADHPALSHLHHPLWVAHAANLDPQQQELLRNLTLSQLQHATAMQQQLTLAALANQFAGRPELSLGGVGGTSHPLLGGSDALQLPGPTALSTLPPLPPVMPLSTNSWQLPELGGGHHHHLGGGNTDFLTLPPVLPLMQHDDVGAMGRAAADSAHFNALLASSAHTGFNLTLTAPPGGPHNTGSSTLAPAPLNLAVAASSSNGIGAAAAVGAAGVITSGGGLATTAAEGEAAALPALAVGGLPSPTTAAALPPLEGGAVLPGSPHDVLMAQVLELQNKLKAQGDQVAVRDAELVQTQRALRAAEGRLRTKTQLNDPAVPGVPAALQVGPPAVPCPVATYIAQLGQQQPAVGPGANRHVATPLPPRKRHQAGPPAAGGTSSGGSGTISGAEAVADPAKGALTAAAAAVHRDFKHLHAGVADAPRGAEAAMEG